MKNSKLLKLLSSFSSREWTKLIKMSISPYFTNNKKIEILLRYLQPYTPNFDELEKTVVFAKVFEESEYDDDKLRKLFTESVNLVNQLFLIEKQKQEPLNTQLDLLEIYQERSITNEYSLLEKKLTKFYKNTEILTPEFIQRRRRLHRIQLQRLNVKQAKTRREIIRAEIIDLEDYTNINMAILNSYLNNDKNQLKPDEWTLPKYEPFLKILYQNLTHLILHFDQKLFDALLELYYELPPAFPKHYKLEFFRFLLNANVRQYQLNPEKHLESAFNLNVEGVENGTLLKFGKISVGSFTNIIFLGSKLKRFDWVEMFIEKYQKMLPKSEKAESLFIGRLNFLFYKKEFEQALELWNKKKAYGIAHSIQTNITHFRILFELILEGNDYHELLINKINSYRRGIVEKKELNQFRRKIVLNFLSAMRELADFYYRLNTSPKSSSKLEKIIFESKGLVGKDWFIEKLNQIKNETVS